MKQILGVLLSLWVAVSFAGDGVSNSSSFDNSGHAIKPEVILKHIYPVKEQEHDGDELYVTLSAQIDTKSKHYSRIPEYPNHWLSRKAEQIHDIQLWSELLEQGESVRLVIELNEQDSLPMNPDDLLGIMALKITNDDGKMKVVWDSSSHSDVAAKSTGKNVNQYTFDLKSGGAHYAVDLIVK